MDIHPLRRFRESQSPPINQAALAELLGVERATISRWESGERQPGPEVWALIEEKTGIPRSELRPDLFAGYVLAEAPDPHPPPIST